MNRVVHFEIPADDIERAQKFYNETFGWKLVPMGGEYGNYVVVQTGPTDEQGMPKESAFINGGLFKRDPSAKAPILVLGTDDCDGTVKKAEEAGGKLIGEILDIPNVGRYARVQDPEGNVIAIIKPIMPGNPQAQILP
ncbi:MAG: VOC family protein [Candidatus Pacebacteria bacterium]|nr:VOC family protein [Candidatus Paceibacterota bacterium]